MGFKKLGFRSVLLLGIASVMLIGTVLTRMSIHKPVPEQSPQLPTTQDNKITAPVVGTNFSLPVGPASNNRQANELTPEDSQSIKDMKEQMDTDRLQQKKIKMLKLQLEQTNLQLEQEKALSEINKLEKDNTSVVNMSDGEGQDKYPDIKVIYIGGTDKDKEAILSINGNNYAVKELNKPVKNVQVLSISGSAVTVHFNLPLDLTTSIEYKPE